MAVEDAARRAALAVHKRARRVHDDESRYVELATIRRMKPTLQAELHESPDVLELAKGDQGNLHLSDLVRWWEAQFGLMVDDALVVCELSNGSWVALAVISGREVGAGARALKAPATQGAGLPHPDLASSSEAGLVTATSSAVPAGGGTPTITLAWSHHIVKKMEVYDSAGVRVGWIPVFQDLP